MSIIWTIIIGFIVGIVAKFLMPGRDPGGFFITAALGVVGSIIATYLGRFFGWYGPNEPAGFIMSVIGAIILLVLYRMIAHRQT